MYMIQYKDSTIASSEKAMLLILKNTLNLES